MAKKVKDQSVTVSVDDGGKDKITLKIGDPFNLKPEHKVILDGIQLAIETLFRRHFEAIMTRAESEQADTVRIGFPVAIEDMNMVDRMLKVGMSWTMSMKDSLMGNLPDPSQPTFEFMTVDQAKAARAEIE